MPELSFHEKQLNATIRCNQEQADSLTEIADLLRVWSERCKDMVQRRDIGHHMVDDYGNLESARDELLLIIAGVHDGMTEQDQEILESA